MAKKKRPIKTNVDINYLLPMCRRSDPNSAERREVKVISHDDGMLRFQVVEDAELFEIHSFWDEYFQFLLYTGYAIPIEE